VEADTAPEFELKLRLAPPVDLAASLRPFGRWGDDGIDRWDGATLLRTVRLDADDPSDWTALPYAAGLAGDIGDPVLHVHVRGSDQRLATQIASAIERSFVPADDSLTALAAADERIGRLVRLYPGVIPVLVPDPFTALLRSISAQQVNLRWAATVRRRLAERYGRRHAIAGTFVYSLGPGPLAATSVEELRDIQLTTAKSRSLIACARAALDGELRLSALERMADETLIDHLTQLPGIGRWSGEWFLARTLGRPRVVAGDLGVRKAVGRVYGIEGVPSEEEVRRLTGHWGSAAAIAQALALHDLAVASGVA
jgi:DNA-3-methyladenine glycosylase II